VTEGLLLDRSEAVEALLRELAGRGHRIALDDFGTGFSSMAYLKRFPVHAIKIDRVFVEGLGEGGDSEAIVSAIVAMSHALGKSVIAEGAETASQVEILRALGCDEVQGFFIAKALPAPALEAFLRERQPRTAGSSLVGAFPIA
jgi:EAL domain-containing protein (putative c-di-GMP-specific phosphodiesterase class I)